MFGGTVGEWGEWNFRCQLVADMLVLEERTKAVQDHEGEISREELSREETTQSCFHVWSVSLALQRRFFGSAPGSEAR